MTHTPGPWKWRNIHEREVVVGDCGRRVAVLLETEHRPIPCNDPVIFAIREDWIGELSPEREAAKHLIAAAPDLLAALRDLTETVEVAIDAGLYLSVDGKRPDVMALLDAKALLAKVEGTS